MLTDLRPTENDSLRGRIREDGLGLLGQAERTLLGAALHPIAIEPVEHFPAGVEERHRLLFHLDCLVGARIASDAGGALFHGEDAEPTQLDALAASQSGSDLVEYRRDDLFSILVPQMWIGGGEFRDEFCPGHRLPPSAAGLRLPRDSFSTQSEQRGSRALSTGAANQ